MRITKLTCEYSVNPIGIGAEHPLLRWTTEGGVPAHCRVAVATKPELLDTPDLWDSGDIGEAFCAVYNGKPLASDSAAYWRVEAQGERSETASWRSGIAAVDWKAAWIGYDIGRDEYDPTVPYYCADDFEKGTNTPFLPKPSLLRHEFTVNREVASAVLYVSAMGLTEMYLNGAKAVKGHLVPGLCDYRKRVYYMTYDVKPLVRAGGNALSAVLADGWYAGYIGLNPRQWWGAKPRLGAQLCLTYTDGSRDVIATDDSWRVCTGPWLYADIMHGTGYDSTLEPAGWKEAGYDDSSWSRPDTGAEYSHIPCAYPGVPVVEHGAYPAKVIKRINDNEAILDTGRCMSGVVRLRVRGPKGAKIDLYHAEQMEMDGSELFYFGNRSAQCHDVYVLSGEGEEVWQPEFTYHGFRFVHVYGLAALTEYSFEAVAVSTELPDATRFETGNETLARVLELIRNTEQSNIVDQVTDVCARDERLGWGCEGNLFMHTACSLNNNARFLRKWLADALDGQQEDGAMWAIAPAVMMKDIVPFAGDLQSDIALHCTWLLMRHYDDRASVAAAFPALERYFAWSVRNSDRLLRYATARDWLDLSHDGRSDTDHGYGGCDPILVGTGWFAVDARLMAELADYLGLPERVDYYTGMYGRIRGAFRTFLLGRNHLLRGATQGGCCLAAVAGLLESEDIAAAREWVRADMEKNGGITWGTATTPIALFGMCELGFKKEACEFIVRRAFPSIGYMCDQGATAAWERWDAILNGAFHPHQMNAFDHIGLATVGNWILEGAAGIVPVKSGCREVSLSPVTDACIGSLSAEYESVYGTVKSAWKYTQAGFSYEAEIPCGVSARLRLPVQNDEIRILKGAEGVSQARCADGVYEADLTAGRYEFIIGHQ